MNLRLQCIQFKAVRIVTLQIVSNLIQIYISVHDFEIGKSKKHLFLQK